MRVSTFPLDLRLEADAATKTVMSSSSHAPPVNKSKWLIPLEGDLCYSTLLGEPYKPTFSGANGVKLSLPVPSFGSKEITLTPDTLRYLAKTSSEVRTQLISLQLAYRTALHRIMEQKTELGRQSATCKSMEQTIENLKEPIRKETEERFVKIQEEQKDLLARLDRLLQALMRQASPELSEHENKWFEELKRMKEDILGRGKYDEDSLASRTRLVRRPIDTLPHHKLIIQFAAGERICKNSAPSPSDGQQRVRKKKQAF